MKIKTGDFVQIIAGKDKGKKGKVIQVFPRYGKVIVEGANLRTKHIRSRQRGEKGQKIEFPAPIDASNVTVVCPKTGKPTRIGYKVSVDSSGKKTKVRIAKASGEVLDKETKS